MLQSELHVQCIKHFVCAQINNIIERYYPRFQALPIMCIHTLQERKELKYVTYVYIIIYVKERAWERGYRYCTNLFLIPVFC